jgi:hypothetical protein
MHKVGRQTQQTFLINYEMHHRCELKCYPNLMEDFIDLILALPQITAVSILGRPKQFISLIISTASMTLSSFYAVGIT